MLPDPLVLSYHAVARLEDEDDPNRLATAPELLASHVRFLRRLGYRFASAEDMLEGATRRGRTAVITFDDGWRDALTTAWPLLQELSVPATFYVCPGWWGGRHPDVPGPAGALLSAAEARELAGAGAELGGHAMTHPDLRKLGDDELAEQLTRSKAEVEAVTGRPCRTMAYPFGLVDDRVEQAAKRAGYELAFAWEPGPWRTFRAPRWPAPPRHGAGRMALKLLGVRRRKLTA